MFGSPPMVAVAPPAFARSTNPETRSRCCGWICGPRSDVGVAGVALAQGGDLVGERLLERIREALVHEQPGAGEADLARVVVLLDRQVDREVEVGVAEDDARALAAELEADRGEVLCCRSGDRLRGRHRTGERDAGDAGMRGQRGARLLAVTLHDVEHPGR